MKSSSYFAACREIDITPILSAGNPIFLQGMAGAPRKALSVVNALKLQILLLEDRNHTKILLAAADILGFDPSMVKRLHRLGADWGIEPEGLILNASHTHYAPGTMSHMPAAMGPFYPQYAERIVQLIEENLPLLYRQLEACELSYGSVEAQIGVNRRVGVGERVEFAPNPSGVYESNTPFLMVRLMRSRRRILLANHGCHPTGLGKAPVVSSGYPGFMRDALISAGAADCVIFLQGAAGTSKESVLRDGNIVFCDHIAGVEANGKRLAECVEGEIDHRLEIVDGSIFCSRAPLSLPFQSTVSQQDLTGIIEDPHANPVIREWARKVFVKNPAGKPSDHLPMAVQLVWISDHILFLSFPAEPAAELVQCIRDQIRIPERSFILGYTNGLQSYLPSDAMIEAGGYEVEESHIVYQNRSALGRGTEREVVNAVRDGIAEKDCRDRANGYGRYHLAHRRKEAFFVLSSGRCGTMTLARLLNTAENARVWHHPQPDLLVESLMAYRGEIDKRSVFWRARHSLIHRTWSEGLIHGETDLLMTPFSDMLAEEIPDSKFIVLVRSPADFVRSGMRRNYYHGHPWDIGRLRPAKKSPDYDGWRKLDQFEKICWLWNESYAQILEIARRIPADRIMELRFEDLIDDRGKLREVFSFLNLKGYNDKAVDSVLQLKLNAQQAGSFPPPESWPGELNMKIAGHCGPLAERFGYRVESDDRKRRQMPPAMTSLWDYKKFDHKRYPSRIDVGYFREQTPTRKPIDSNSKITSIGSCFARNIAGWLMTHQYRYLVTEEPFQQASAHWDQVFNTACLRQIFDYTFDRQWSPLVRWWPRGNRVQDPFRRNILYAKESCEADFDRHREASRRALSQADVVILTLGLIETWRDKRDQMTFYRVPSPQIYDPRIHEFYVQTIDDCLNDLNCLHRTLFENNPAADIIVTVSPVPLFASFRSDVDAVSANTMSKSTLRVAAEYFAERHPNVFYFPSYEIVTQALPNPYEADNRHVTARAIDEVMKLFEEQLILKTDPADSVAAGPKVA